MGFLFKDFVEACWRQPNIGFTECPYITWRFGFWFSKNVAIVIVTVMICFATSASRKSLSFGVFVTSRMIVEVWTFVSNLFDFFFERKYVIIIFPILNIFVNFFKMS